MTDTSPDDALLEAEQSSGWLQFASIVLIVAGIMRILDAIWSWRYNGVLPDGFQRAVLGNDLDTYGWLWHRRHRAHPGRSRGDAPVPMGPPDRDPRRRHPDHHGDRMDALLSSVVLIYIFVGIFVIYGLAAHGGRLRMPV
jgi:hypothetical protein